MRTTMARPGTWLLALLLFRAFPILAQVGVLTQHNDAARTGANLSETQLTTGNVNVTQFGKLFTRSVDGQLYAQPLVVPSVSIPGKGTRTVVYVATMHNSVYAFDADDSAAVSPYWQVNLGPSVPYLDVSAASDILPEIGITSTPVVDPGTNTIYVVAKTKESGSYFYRLHALDLSTGAEKLGGPVVISGTIAGSTPFGAFRQLNRPGLLLQGGVVYIAFGSHSDYTPSNGWVFAYNASTLVQMAKFMTTPAGYLGSIWQSGQGLASDGSSLYFITGNGNFDYNVGGRNLAMSYIKLSTPDLSVLDWFAPYDYSSLNLVDQDLGSSGAMLIPGTNLVVGGGKDGVLHLLTRTSLGHYQAGSDSQTVQRLPIGNGNIHGSPVYWAGPSGPFVYVWPEYDQLKQLKMSGGLFQTTPYAKSTMFAPDGMPGGMLSISANGSAAGTGILWATHPFSGNANSQTVPGILRAFDASNVATELWNSKQNAARDDFGNFAKYSSPTVANGKVYLGTFSNQLWVYGLLGGNTPPNVSITSPADGAGFTAPASITINATASDPGGSVTKVDFYNGSTLLGTDTTSPYSYAWNGVSAGSYTLTAVATDNLLATRTSTAVHVTVSNPGGSLPAPWLDQDIGPVGIPGSASFAGATFTVKGSGDDIETTQDRFHYVYQPLNGDGQIIVRVASVQNTDPWAKAGAMIRDTLSPSSVNAMVFVSPSNGVNFQWRDATGGTTSRPGSRTSAPRWLKLVRAGNTFTGYESSDGSAWTYVFGSTFVMATNAYVGLAVTSHNNAVLNTSLFDGVTVGTSTNNLPTVAITSPLEGATFTAPASVAINATASDSDGTVTKVDFYNGSTLLGTDTTSPYSYAWNGVPAGNYTLTAVATDNLLGTRTSTAVHITITNPAGSLPPPWLDQDVGNVGIVGSATFSGSTFTVRGAGADIMSGSDAFHWVYQPLNGNGQIIARVVSVQNTDPSAKAGVMIRESLGASSTYAMMTVTAGQGLTFMRGRPTGTGFTQSVPTSGSAPYWVKLVRTGSIFSAFRSVNGVLWTLVDTDLIPMAPNAYVGLAVSAHASALNTSLFDGVSKIP